mmetsp:Transcript_7203/g.20938  ORF Transcript_7203/g.20938 Transcript_7203/m.20938 type:complete len:224 (+) Transcript_7203:228-899(+)
MRKLESGIGARCDTTCYYKGGADARRALKLSADVYGNFPQQISTRIIHSVNLLAQHTVGYIYAPKGQACTTQQRAVYWPDLTLYDKDARNPSHPRKAVTGAATKDLNFVMEKDFHSIVAAGLHEAVPEVTREEVHFVVPASASRVLAHRLDDARDMLPSATAERLRNSIRRLRELLPSSMFQARDLRKRGRGQLQQQPNPRECQRCPSRCRRPCPRPRSLSRN